MEFKDRNYGAKVSKRETFLTGLTEGRNPASSYPQKLCLAKEVALKKIQRYTRQIKIASGVKTTLNTKKIRKAELTDG